MSYREYQHFVDVHLDFLDILEFEGQILHKPLVSQAFIAHIFFQDEDVRDDLFASAAPHLAAAHQHLPQIVHVPRTARPVGVVNSHRHAIVGLRRLVVDHARDAFAWRRF